MWHFTSISLDHANGVQVATNPFVVLNFLTESVSRSEHELEEAILPASTPGAMKTAELLAEVYGHVLEKPVMYTQGVALSGRLRLSNLRSETEKITGEIIQVVEAYSESSHEIFNSQDGTANFAGLCWADELFEITNDQRYFDIAIFAADLFGPTVDEGPLDPDLRVEDIFFAGTMLGRAFKLSGNERYIELLVDFLNGFSTLQSNGLWWHCVASPYFWGRGNAFAALGFAEALSYIPDQHPDRNALLEIHVRHLEGLRNYQNESGMWRQVVDLKSTYLEHSATTMIGYAITRGLNHGWLGSEWKATADLAWSGASKRIGPNGELEQVCVGTGPQPDLQAYIDRKFSLGRDDRGGSMALWFAVERAVSEQTG